MLKDILASVSKKMQIDFAEITSKIQHNGEKGTAREFLLEKYLKSYIPEKYCFSKGTIVDSKDEQSRQVDIIIHDKFLTPFLVDEDNTKIVPIESVYATIEVKSTLTKEELKKCIENIESVKRLEKNTITGYSMPTAGMVFAYDSDASLETVYKNLIEMSNNIGADRRINCICILNKGIILPIDKKGMRDITLFPNTNTIYGLFNNENEALLLFYLVLIQVLNSIAIFPPNMVAYAQSTGMLKTTFSIPAEYVPDDGTFNFMGNMISMAELKRTGDFGSRFMSGKLKKEEFLECMFGTYIPLLLATHGSLDKVPEESNLIYFGTPISNKELVKMHNIYMQRENITSEQQMAIDQFEDFMFAIYDHNRDEMLKNVYAE